MEATNPDPSPADPAGPESLGDQLHRLTTAANGGDVEALAGLRALLDSNSFIWRDIGDVAAQAELALIRAIASSNRLVSESLERQVNELKLQLTAPGASTLERMAVCRIVATWLHLHYVDHLLVNAAPASGEANYLLKLQGQSSKQYDSAVKSLAIVQKLVPHPAVATPSVPQAKPAAPGQAESAAVAAASVQGGPVVIPIRDPLPSVDGHAQPNELPQTGT